MITKATNVSHVFMLHLGPRVTSDCYPLIHRLPSVINQLVKISFGVLTHKKNIAAL